jgi:serine/threonine protein kinase
MVKDNLLEGKYRILSTLGQGGMGRVYLAENIKLGTLWAIKHLQKKPSSSCNLYIEPNILKKLNHPALPRIFDIFEDAGNIYIVVDYIEGVSLDKKLEEVGSFPEEVVLEWAAQLCDVLMYLHGIKPNPIIYRDMKPANIILAEGGRLKLIDFGIAREYKSGTCSDTICIGTRGYAAPEQYGAGQTSVASDIYSLGVTLYHLLTGKSPNEAHHIRT